MSILIEPTTNPNILKFICPSPLLEGDLEFTKESQEQSALTKQLFAFPFVSKVYITANFVAVQKTDEMEWEHLMEGIKSLIDTHYNSRTIVPIKTHAAAFTLYAETTPNPNSMKFVANQMLTSVNIEVKNESDAVNVPLAKEIFSLGYIKEVFVSENYITVIKSENEDWQQITMPIRELILNHLKNGGQVIDDNYQAAKPNTNHTIKSEFSDIELKIKDILEEYIKPAVANDGGNIDLIEFNPESKTAYMLLQGSCSGCPSSTITLKNGIETMLKQMLPNVVDHVEAVNG